MTQTCHLTEKPMTVGETTSPPTVPASKESRTTIWDYVITVLVLGIALFLGTIVAIVIGFATGWIDIVC